MVQIECVKQHPHNCYCQEVRTTELKVGSYVLAVLVHGPVVGVEGSTVGAEYC